MLNVYFKKPRVLCGIHSEEFNSYLNDFAKRLHITKYARGSILNQLRAAAHFCVWAELKRLDARMFDEKTIKSFRQHLPRCRCPGPPRGKSPLVIKHANNFIDHLRHIGVVESIQDPAPQESRSPLLINFLVWMREHRGLSDGTLKNYERYITDLLDALGDEPSKFTAKKIRKFVQQRTRYYRKGGGGTKGVFTAVRMFLRYLAINAKTPQGLVYALPRLASWRMKELPYYLQPSDVNRLIESCDTTKKIGLRDRAVLLLLARLGLRRGEVSKLLLSDISWEEGCIRLLGKSKREVMLPLPQEVGDAIIAYIEFGRPQVDSDYLFLRAIAPYKPFANGSTVSVIVGEAFLRSGVESPSHGAHILRSSAATEMLRQGVSLHDIANVLRHRSINTTTLYTKVDVNLLQQVTQPWPEVLQ